MSMMFYQCAVFNADIRAWDTLAAAWKWALVNACREGQTDADEMDFCRSSVTTMNIMFAVCGKFDTDIGAWDTSRVISMSNMFNSAHTCAEIKVSRPLRFGAN